MAGPTHDDTKVPHHFFVKYELDDEEVFVLVGTVASFVKEQVSEATLKKINGAFREKRFDATPVKDPEKEGLPLSFSLYSFQSAKNPTQDH